MQATLQFLSSVGTFRAAFDLQLETQKEFHARAARILGREALGPVDPKNLTLKGNFFSTLFLAVTRLAAQSDRRLPLYAIVNQTMRACVTAADNILDDEYKEIFPFTQFGGMKMRSVVTVMLADRILFEFVRDRYSDDGVAEAAGRSSLRPLIVSAIEESEEEQPPMRVLTPEEVMRDVHARKTGSLFEAPLDLPTLLEKIPDGQARDAKDGLHHFGLGCQVLDDMKDAANDARMGRHNLVLAILHQHGKTAPAEGDWTAWEAFPDEAAAAGRMARREFARSFEAFGRLGFGLSEGQQRAVVGMMADLLGVPLGSN